MSGQEDDRLELLGLEAARVHRDLLLELVNVSAGLRTLDRFPGQMTRFFFPGVNRFLIVRFPHFRFPRFRFPASVLDDSSGRERSAVDVAAVGQVVVVVDDVR